MHIPHLSLWSALLFGLADGAVCGAPVLTEECQGLPDVQRQWVQGWLTGIRAGRYRHPLPTDDEAAAINYLRFTPEQSLAFIENEHFSRCIFNTRFGDIMLRHYVAGFDLSEARDAHISPYRFWGITYLSNLRYLDLSWTQVDDIHILAWFSNLRELNLSGTAVEDLAPLAELANLRELNLTDLPAAAVDNVPRALLAMQEAGDLTIEYGGACLK